MENRTLRPIVVSIRHSHCQLNPSQFPRDLHNLLIREPRNESFLKLVVWATSPEGSFKSFRVLFLDYVKAYS